MLQPKLVTPPVATPITLDEAKAWAHVDFDDDDAVITSMIEAATGYFDGYSGILGRAIMQQTWALEFSSFTDLLRLPLGPLIQVVSVKYFDSDNVEQILATEVYGVCEYTLGSLVELVSGQSWPAVFDRSDAVLITFEAGYADIDAVPAPIKTAIKMLVADLYDNRESQLDAGKLFENSSYAGMVFAYRRIGF